jgi:beta-galactosidase
VLADGDQTARLRFGRTGALPHIGVGWYRKQIDIPTSWEGKKIFVEFDGAMSNAQVYFNGDYVGEWPYGYSSFSFDISSFCLYGESNLLAIRLENYPQSSRWYPGAGLYRNVRVVVTAPVHIAKWGTYITTPEISLEKGRVAIQTTIEGLNLIEESEDNYELITEISDPSNRIVAKKRIKLGPGYTNLQIQYLDVKQPYLWSVDAPNLYRVTTRIRKNKAVIDVHKSSFGFRYFEFTSDKGFYLNGENFKLQGVCLHHDMGPIGAAVNQSALERQLMLLKEMGCNAIRTSHNPPAPELLDLCDEMGFLVIVEAFDEWKIPKVMNGYNRLWDQWAEKDLTAMIHRDRNHPSVIMWSIGNEILEQKIENGADYCRFLTDICHREDPTRPVTAGFNHWKEAVKHGFPDIVDVVGWNYNPQNYQLLHKRYPHWKMYGSETASTVSSRGEYFFPAEPRIHYVREPRHCSSYDMEYPRWANSPDEEFIAQDSSAFIAGEFVWTGFDYLGEPTPYNEVGLSRSSYFGILDLCGIPKDRYYLYQSKWTNKEVLHLLPHWNWEGKEGQIIPVHCYTNFNRAELFLNGRSLGIREKNPDGLFTANRLIWDSVPYEPGELKVVALDPADKPLKEISMQTAGEPRKIELTAFRDNISLDQNELLFITASIIDSSGILCPVSSNRISFEVEQNGIIIATGNGDPTNLESFSSKSRNAFNGKCLVVIQPTNRYGKINVVARSSGLETASEYYSVD